MQWFKPLGSSLKIERLANAVKDSLWQANCPLCKRPADGILCKDCDRQITAYQAREFLQKDNPISLEIPLYSWGIYDGALKRAIAACKYENHPEIMEAIAVKIADTWQRSAHTKTKNLQKASVIPIPLHANKLKSRGFNQAEILARRFCDLTTMPLKPQLLQRVKETKAQMQTNSKQEREQNLSHAFAVPSNQKSNHRNVILFDDIYTTGVTIREAIATLSDSNIAVRGVIVLARPQFTNN
ncbi:MAG: ComF family protein [Pseudanabaena frigida]|uniref:ComF family protein n=1 Tax=Pseudanabaena frigida TaxID=945775 RepID=A0A2W4WJ22_9CYAN|nr:MAG: ComF family protein [Pseudanabaena frigida]